MKPEDDLDEDAAARAHRQAEDRKTALRLVCQPCQNGDHSGHDQNDRAKCPGCICPWGPCSEENKHRKAEDQLEQDRRRAEAAEHGRITIPAPTNPQVHLLTWYIVNCARCAERWYEDCDAVPGGATEARAVGDAIRDWQIKAAPDGKLYCEECFTIRACEAEGHPWDEWLPSWAVEFPDRDVRYCPRCDDVEVRVVAAAGITSNF